MTDCDCNTPPLCTPDSIPEDRRSEHRERLEMIVMGRLRGAEATVSELTLVYGAEDFLELARWVELERLCCPFASFELRVSGEDARLRLCGPEGTAEYLLSLVTPAK